MTNEEQNQPQKKNSGLKNVGTFFLAGILGFGLGYVSLALVPQNLGNASFYAVPLTLLCFFLGYLLQFIVHEAGHLVFGLLTGYTFVSFRVGSFTIIKRDGKLQLANMNIPGTGGQCLMSPPEYENGNFSFLLYNLGGILLNLVSTVVSLMIVSENLPVAVNLLLVGFGLAGVFTAVTNGLPRIVGGIPTDGYNILSIMRNSDVKQAFWLQLKVNDLLSQGIRPKELPMDEYELENKGDLAHPLITSAHLMRYNYYLDQTDFEKARECLDELAPYENELIPLFQNEMKLERLFLELIGENNPAVVREIYDEQLIQYIQMTRNWLNRKRVLMAYEWFQRKDSEKAMEYYRELNELASRHPNEGEAKMEIMLGDWLKEQMLTVPEAEDDQSEPLK